MAWSPSWLGRFADGVGPPDSIHPVGGAGWRASVGGRSYMVKSAAGAAHEAAGLRALAAHAVSGAPPVPDVVVADPDLLVTTWIDQGRRHAKAEEGLGRALAALHTAPHAVWGGGSGWIGQARVDPAEHHRASAFYAARLTGLARRCGLAGPMERLVGRLEGLLPPGGPALLHGDLWWGNVLWGADGRAWLIDPSVHGGYPEEDLAMLALFGDVPDHLLGAYREVNPLPDGWARRVELFQLYPLLVHAVLFGGSYGPQAEEITRRYS